ncbi:unnamed protein product [Polarella glacialis]|uniref:Isocitrate dehydrogenase (NADP(+)) n=1 Tax=Polarella glacialis TaxID=89957 RepID=A0A813K417_POLGL|nr:unnamed protein product [Polarella glacialis]
MAQYIREALNASVRTRPSGGWVPDPSRRATASAAAAPGVKAPPPGITMPPGFVMPPPPSRPPPAGPPPAAYPVAEMPPGMMAPSVKSPAPRPTTPPIPEGKDKRVRQQQHKSESSSSASGINPPPKSTAPETPRPLPKASVKARAPDLPENIKIEMAEEEERRQELRRRDLAETQEIDAARLARQADWGMTHTIPPSPVKIWQAGDFKSKDPKPTDDRVARKMCRYLRHHAACYGRADAVSTTAYKAYQRRTWHELAAKGKSKGKRSQAAFPAGVNANWQPGQRWTHVDLEPNESALEWTEERQPPRNNSGSASKWLGDEDDQTDTEPYSRRVSARTYGSSSASSSSGRNATARWEPADATAYEIDYDDHFAAERPGQMHFVPGVMYSAPPAIEPLAIEDRPDSDDDSDLIDWRQEDDGSYIKTRGREKTRRREDARNREKTRRREKTREFARRREDAGRREDARKREKTRRRGPGVEASRRRGVEASRRVESVEVDEASSAVNPVLREGNSDRRAAVSVKEYAFKYPHSMGKWAPDCKTHVASMHYGDFYSHEKSVCLSEACEARIELVAEDGSVSVLKEKLPLKAGEIEDARAKDVLFSLHLKATMMKISDPIMFGHCVKAYFKDVFAKYADTFAKLGVDANNGLGDVEANIASLPEAERKAIQDDIKATYAKQGKMAMVDSSRGFTNLHVPSDIIIDNSMPTAIRGGGKMWNADDKEEDFKACIPDRCYAGVFQECIEFCRKNGAFDPKTMGSCPNVGLMAQKAEEYGSHPTTFEAATNGTIRIVLNGGSNKVLLGHRVRKGDIWRSCQTKDAPIKDWVKLAVFKPEGLDIQIMSPEEAMRLTCQRAKDGLNTITVTGNVLRDYLTDLFPILELGTSSKMLSSVPLLAGGGMYETGAGGSAPKHVEQFTKEGHLRWDSLGEYLALTSSIEDLGKETGNKKAAAVAAALDKAVGTFLSANKNPSRKVKEIDNRGSHYWVARYWAEELAKQQEVPELHTAFAAASKGLQENEANVLQEMLDCQGAKVDLGGHYHVDKAKTNAAMNPSATFNEIIARIEQGGADAKL